MLRDSFVKGPPKGKARGEAKRGGVGLGRWAGGGGPWFENITSGRLLGVQVSVILHA